MKKLFLTLFLICLMSSVAVAANTVTRSGPFIEIVPDGTTDWDSQVTYPSGLSLVSIAFYPSAANDVIKIREGSATGPAMINGKDTTGGGLIVYLEGGMVHPYLKASDCTFGTAANARILMKFR